MTYDKRMMIDYCRRMMESLRRTTNRQLSPNDGKLTMYNEQTTVAEWWKACNVRQTDDDRRLSPNDGKLTTYNEQTTVAEWWKAYDVRWTDDDRRLSLNEEKLTPYNEQTMTDDCRWMKESLRRTTNRRWQTIVAEWWKAYNVRRTDDETTVAEWWKAYDVQQTDDDRQLSLNEGKLTTYNEQMMRRLSPNDGKLTTYDEQTMTDDCRRMMESLRRTTNRQWQMTVAERRKAYDVQRTDDDRRLSPNDGKPTTYNKQTRTDDCRWMMAKAKIKLFYCLF